VAKVLQEHGLDKGAQFLGSSAGALVSAGLAIGVDFDIVKVV
jgi:predicted acylesterase/phospholipase RssA